MKQILFLLILFAVSSNLHAQIIRDSIYSEILSQTRYINIYTAGLSDFSNSKMSTVYVLDGHSLFLNLTSGNFDFISEVNSSYCGILPFLAVGIESDTTRMEDFMVVKQKAPQGRADQFLDFLSLELIPYIESNYPVTKHRVGVGHSLGGSLLMHAFNSRDTLFNAYLMFSPNLIYSKNRLLNNFKAGVEKPRKKFAYVTVGDVGGMEIGFKNGVRMLDSLVQKGQKPEGATMKFEYLNDAFHHESLPLSIARAVKEYFNDFYAAPHKQAMNALLESADGYDNAVKRYLEQKSAYLGYHYDLPPYGFYNDYLLFGLEMERFDQVLEIADFAISRNKGSLTEYILYLGKSIAQEKLKDRKGALESCQQALKSLEGVKDQYSEEDYGDCLDEIKSRVEELTSQSAK